MVDVDRGEILIAGGVVRAHGQPLIDKDTKTHARRRFMATPLVAGGIDWRTVSGRAGHADGHMTLATYARFQQARTGTRPISWRVC